MMDLFRKIRQKLLAHLPDDKAGNRITQYLAYAIGEIILVVIGVMLALQVNTWKEECANRAQESSFYMALPLW
ncbi:hypothetical protein U3A58_06545 [Algoriphagus sp. C2-6-M1]|uniref:hypothetical protein n=1 Tax=Algoriphagus persicinus TaxID=3108754 RepID=UPI002B37BA8B|nr:hypothetical protein [Algoriphagus sp. C2-6-M1]MEB2780044.1 hypothetical protein [Algoriphagus sp. C2-6-M1]